MRRPAPNKFLRSIGAITIVVSLLITPSSSSSRFFFFASAYRIGDAVGILLRTHTPSAGSANLEAYRHQLPRFGVSTRTRFDVSSLLDADDLRLAEDATNTNTAPPQQKKRPPSWKRDSKEEAALNEHLRLSLSFDEGFHRIPWLDVYNPTSRGNNNNRALENLVITIVYSGSDGSIHAVHRETKYGDDDSGSGGGAPPPKSFTVEYVWVNEADVDVRGGLLALFLAVLMASLGGMIGACTTSSSSSADDDIDRTAKGQRYKEKHSSSLDIGSSEGFTKRL